MSQYEWEHLPQVSAVFEEKLSEINSYVNFLNIISSRHAKITHDKDYNAEFDSNQCNLGIETASPKKIIYSTLEISPQHLYPLKSATFLLFYNFIESISTLMMKDIHESISDNIIGNGQNLNKLRKDIWNMIINHTKSLEDLRKHIDACIDAEKSIEFILIENWLAHFNGKFNDEDKAPWFSGNVEAKAISNIGAKYGFLNQDSFINWDKNQKSTLFTIRNYRNQLAHGNQTFTDIGKNTSVHDLNLHFKHIELFFKHLLDKINYYLHDKHFLENSNQ